MDFKARIEAAQKRVNETRDKMTDIFTLAESEQRDMTDEESAQMEVLEGEFTTATKALEDAERAERVLGADVVKRTPANPDNPGGPAIITRRDNTRERPKGDMIFKMATVSYLAHVEKKTAEQVLQERYGHDRDFTDVYKSAVSPAATDVAGWAAELVDDALQGFLDLLRGTTTGWAILGAAGLQLTFDRLGSIKIPGWGGTDQDLGSGFTGENDAIPVKRGTTEVQTVNPGGYFYVLQGTGDALNPKYRIVDSAENPEGHWHQAG